MSRSRFLLSPAIGALIATGAIAAPALGASTPAITSATPTKNAVFAERQVNVAASASDTACMRLSVEDDTTRAQVYGEVIVGSSFARTVTVPADGRYRAVISAVAEPDCRFDGQGAQVTNRFDVDSTPPAPFALINQTRTCPGGACFLSERTSLDLEWNRADDAGGISHYEVLVSGVVQARTQARRYSLPMSGIANLSTISVVAVDIAGNRREAAPSAPVLHDVSAPSVSFVAPTSPWLRGRVHLAARVADDPGGSGVDHAGFTMRPLVADQAPRGDVGLVHGPLDDGSEAVVAFGTGRVADGRHQITAFALDQAGNVGHITRTFTVDNTAPVFAKRARVMDVSASRTITRVPVRVSDELSPRLITSYVVRDTKRSTKPAKLVRSQKVALAKAQRTLRSLRYVGTDRQVEVAKARVAAAKIALANRYVSKAQGAADRGTQRIAIPGRALGVGNYRLTLRVRDLAGNTATRAFTLRVR